MHLVIAVDCLLRHCSRVATCTSDDPYSRPFTKLGPKSVQPTQTPNYHLLKSEEEHDRPKWLTSSVSLEFAS
jgi:hypothetical protein